jgi:hypothetical protein
MNLDNYTPLSQTILRLVDSNTILTSSNVTSQNYAANFFTYKVFIRVIPRLIASFVGASVIGHGILAGIYLAKYHDLLI